MDKMEIEKYRKNLEIIENQLTNEELQKMTKEEIQEYITLVSKIKARLDLLENL